MRIVIDLQGAQTESRFRGIGRYSLSLAKAIVRNRGEHEIIIALNGLFPDTIEPIRAEFDDLLPQENIRVWYAPAPVYEYKPGNTWRREVAELIRESFLMSLQPDIVHITSLFEDMENAVTSIRQFDQITPISTSLYDLIPLLNPDQYIQYNRKEDYQRKIEYLQRSSLLLTISEHSKQEGIEHLSNAPKSIINISTAADKHFHPLSIDEEQQQTLRNKFGITHSVILYAGGADERKNLFRLIRAYAMLPPRLRDVYQLVFAGKIRKSIIYQLKKEAKISGLHRNELIFTGYVTDDELVIFYNICKLHVFPSWHEGFGLPALEAMSCGAAVIAANTSSLPEVIGNESALFDPLSENAIANKITSVLTNEDFRQSLIEHGLNQAKLFSWDNSAKKAISAFEDSKNNNANCRAPATHILSKQIAKIIPTNIPEQSLIDLAVVISENNSQAELKQLFVDVSELSQQDSATGVQRVTRNILMELLNSPPVGYQVEPVYATQQSNGYYYARTYTSKLLGQSTSDLIDEPLSFMNGDIFLGLDLQHHVVISQENYFSQIKNKGVSLYFLIHDLLPINLAKYFPDHLASLHEQWLAVISKFDGLVCVSKTTAIEVEKWLDKHHPERKETLKIAYSHNGANIALEVSVGSKGLPVDYNRILSTLKSSCSFLMVSTLEPRKGHKQVLLAFDKLWSKGTNANLVLVGKQGWMVDELIEEIKNHPQLGKRLFWLEGISDEYLEKIYETSTCLIAASEGEGFGLPLIEAAQHGLPIIVRDIPVFREVAGQYAYYFNEETPSGLSKSIEKWLKLFHEQKHPTSDGMPLLTWKQSTDNLIDIILSNEQKSH